MASPARWQLRTTMQMDQSLEPVPSGATPLKLASMPEASVWVGNVVGGHETATTVAVAIVPRGSQVALAVARFTASAMAPPLTAGSDGALRCLSGGASTACLGDVILMFGDQRPIRRPGASGDNEDDVLHLWALRPFSSSAPPSAIRVAVRPAADGGAPGRRQFAAAACSGGRLYVVGGARLGAMQPPFEIEPPLGAALWDAWVFTPTDARLPEAGGAWEALPLHGDAPAGDPPGLRGAAAVVLAPEDPAAAQLLLFGGYTNAGLSADVFAVRLATGQVKRLDPSDAAAPRPAARAHAAAVLLPGGRRVLLAGGGSEFADEVDAWLFDIQERSWTPVALADREFRKPYPEDYIRRSPFGQHTLVLQLPTRAADAADDAVSLIVWGGWWRGLPKGAEPHQSIPTLISDMREMRLERATK
jgi:hypothetical protein